MKTHALVAAFMVLAPIALTGCAGGSEPETVIVTSTTVEAAGEGQASSAAATTTDGSRTAQAVAEYEDLDPELFNLGGGYVVAGTSGVGGCMMKTHEPNFRFTCQIGFNHPVPPVEGLGGAPDAVGPNVAAYSDKKGRFVTEYSPGAQGYMETPRALERGQRVTIDGATMTHLHDGGFRVEYQGDAFEVHDRVYAREGDLEATRALAAKPVEKGTNCGVTYNANGEDIAVVAAEDGTTCGTAMDIMRSYVRALFDGQTQGSAGLWTAPNGWGCTGRWFFPDEEYIGGNGKLACGAQDPSGNPASAGSGEVVGLTVNDLGRIR